MFGEEALIGEIVAERNDMVGCCQEVKTPTKKENQEEGHGSTWNGGFNQRGASSWVSS